MKFNILVDSGFWIALYDPSKKPLLSLDAERISREIEEEHIIVPYPTLYEFINSRLSRKESLIEFENYFKRPNIERLPDNDYKEIAFEQFFKKHREFHNDLSLVDEVIKLVMRDAKLRIHYFVSFDETLLNAAISLGIRTL